MNHDIALQDTLPDIIIQVLIQRNDIRVWHVYAYPFMYFYIGIWWYQIARSIYASQRLNDAQRRSFYALYIVWSSSKLPAMNKEDSSRHNPFKFVLISYDTRSGHRNFIVVLCYLFSLDLFW